MARSLLAFINIFIKVPLISIRYSALFASIYHVFQKWSLEITIAEGDLNSKLQIVRLFYQARVVVNVVCISQFILRTALFPVLAASVNVPSRPPVSFHGCCIVENSLDVAFILVDVPGWAKVFQLGRAVVVNGIFHHIHNCHSIIQSRFYHGLLVLYASYPPKMN